jgi:hypothetical protein
MGTGTLAIITAFAGILAAAFIRHAFDMRKEQKYREMVGAVFWGMLPLGVVCLVWAATGDSPMRLQNSLLGLVGAAIGASAFVWLGYVVRPADAQTEKTTPVQNDKPAQVAQNVTSYNQSGGITAGTVNIGTGRAEFNDQLKADLLQKVPKGNVQLQTIGGNADQAIGNEVEAFLRQNGYSVQRTSIGMMVPAPDRPYSLSVNGNQTVVVVAPSAR